MSNHHRVVLEVADKKSFASFVDWPGWCRSDKTADEAVQSLVDYAGRYQKVAEIAGVKGVMAAAKDPDIVDRAKGNATTEFGAIAVTHDIEQAFMTDAECERQLALLEACWTYFVRTSERVSAKLRKGPRGGGRDRDKIIDHVTESEFNYVREIGVKAPKGLIDSPDGVGEHRQLVVAAIRSANKEHSETHWPLRYAIRRVAWHVLDHAWEMEDKDLSDEEGKSR